MTQNMLFAMLLVTVVLWISGARELAQRRWSMGTLLVAIPVIGWASVYFGQPS